MSMILYIPCTVFLPPDQQPIQPEIPPEGSFTIIDVVTIGLFFINS